jgi:tRNA G18 (ribose-2'-O)-methylase SpoU
VSRGFFGIGIYHCKTADNIGTLWRSAQSFGADFIFTVGRRYARQSSDTTRAPRHVPLYHYEDMDDLVAHLPWACPLVAVELAREAVPMSGFRHTERACYLLGAEDYGLPQEVMARCERALRVEGATLCLNVAVAGSLVMYDRARKFGREERLSRARGVPA